MMAARLSLTVILPTYNERDNVPILISGILRYVTTPVEVLVVDDNSPDGTGAYVEGRSRTDPRVEVLHRPGKLGLGPAYIAGFKRALAQGADYIMEMDADFSHNPARIPEFLDKIQYYDVVIGSRYLEGANVINWPLSRLILSYGANLYTRIITGMPVNDATGGFKCFRREVLASLDLDKIISDGYSFQIEVNYKCWMKGFRIKEIPIIFKDRYQGTSKMSRKIIWEAIWMVWKLRIWGLLGKI
jgi:dolichol-phosphate mannosyltransferase